MTIPATIAICAGLALVSFFLWATIHELAHFLMAKALVGATLSMLRVWPHVIKGRFYWASIRYETDYQLLWDEAAIVHFAPRIPGIIAAIAFPFTATLPSPWLWLIGVVVGAGVVDLATGSIGWSEVSDARRAAKSLGISAWWIRAIGWMAVSVSATAWVVTAWASLSPP